MAGREIVEPPDGTVLLGLDPTPGYEGVFVGVWHRRDDGAWVDDAEHHWFSSYCFRTPTQAFTWAEALERGAQPDRPLVDLAATGVSGSSSSLAHELAKARQALAHAGTGYVPPWEGLTEHERAMSVLDAENWLKALAIAQRTGAAAALDPDDREDLVDRVAAAMRVAHASRRGLFFGDLAAAAVAQLAEEIAAANARADATREMANATNAVLRAKLLTALGVDDDGTTSLAGYVDALIEDRSRVAAVAGMALAGSVKAAARLAAARNASDNLAPAYHAGFAVIAEAREWRRRHADLKYGDTAAITWPPSQALAAAVDRLNEAVDANPSRTTT